MQIVSVRAAGDTYLRAKVLLNIVAVSDGCGIIVFGIAMASLGYFSVAGAHQPTASGLEVGLRGATGAAIGLPAVLLTGQLAPGEPTMVEAITIILLLADLPSMLEVSALLAAILAVNKARAPATAAAR